jgi:thioredoxin reductase
MRYDALVIGGSFTGLSGALQIARTGRPVGVLDSRQPRNRFATESHGFFGFDGTPPGQMIAAARADLAAYPNVTLIDALATHARQDTDTFTVTLSSGQQLEAGKLLLAFGVIDLLPELPGLRERWGQTVLPCPYCHGYEVKGQQLGVLHTFPGSSHQALLISDWGPTTYFLNGQPAPDEATLARLAQRKITVVPDPVLGLEGTAPAITGLRLEGGRVVPIETLFLGTRTRLASPLAEQLGCAVDDGPTGPVIRIDNSMLTTVAGVYAAGDIAQGWANATLASAAGVSAGISLHQALIFEPLNAQSA